MMRCSRPRLPDALILLCIAVVLPGAVNADEPPTPNAASLIDAARAARAVWVDFPGFTADVNVSTGDQTHHGSIRVGSDFEYELTIDPAALQPWVDDKLDSLISHRRPRQSSGEDEGLSYAAGDDPDHVFGPLIVEKDGQAAFRVSDRVVREIHRRSETSWLEISTLKVHATSDGHFLPEVTSVVYRDPATGDVISNRTNCFTWTRVGRFDLPSESLTVDVAADGGRSVRKLTFSGHRLLDASAQGPSRSVIHP